MKQAHPEVLKQLPVLAPQDVAATATRTYWVDTDNCTGLIEFLISFGTLTSTDATANMVVTVEASTSNATTDTGTAIAFSYALSEALGTDTMGAVTAATSTGVNVDSSSDDNKLLAVLVDPAVMKALGDDYRYTCAVIDGDAAVTAALVSAVAQHTPRYSQASQKSSS